jgi:uncharacterized protein
VYDNFAFTFDEFTFKNLSNVDRRSTFAANNRKFRMVSGNPATEPLTDGYFIAFTEDKYMKLKRYVFAAVILSLAFAVNVFAQDKDAGEKKDLPENYNAELAEEVGADDYGMRSYVFVVLKTGKAEIKDEAKRKELFAGHFSNMGRLAEEGKLVLAGPFSEGGDKRGLFIFNVTTLEEAKKLVESDPAVKAGIFEYEMTKWYGSAALMKIGEMHKQIQKKGV